ncbi:MAG: phenylacetate-CoA oxygenase subunit PaaC [Crocinitomicaceae bacterium]|nr:phenylacetate-CoA oxygenase subunit PaaC [Crocinitomicaceae bacterium]
METKEMIAAYATRLGDTSLILSHRLAKLYASGPTLEESVALTNISLDHLGQATTFYQYAAKLNANGLNEDDIAYRRNEREYDNFQLVEQPNTDFAFVMLRQYLVDAFNYHYYSALCDSNDETLAAIAAKAIKEVKYHYRHSREWLLRLGKGTEEAYNKLDNALVHLWSYTKEMFTPDAIDEALASLGIAVDLKSVQEQWERDVFEFFSELKLQIPEKIFQAKGCKEGNHTELLGHILCEMQYLPRAYPDAKW